MSENVDDKPDTCTNSRQELIRNCSPIGHNNTKHFLCPIRSQHSLDRLEMVRWESVHKGSSARAWKLSSGLFSRPDWLPLGLRGCASRWFTSNQMVPNAKKTKPLLIATRQKLQHVNQPTLDLFLTDNRLEEPRMKIPGRQDGQSPYLAQPYRILNWETELKKLFT